MDFREKQSIPNPREKASLVSKLLFLWIVPLFRKGLGKDLQIDDMYDPLKEDVSETLGIKLSREWEKHLKHSEKHNKSPSFFRCITSVFGGFYALLGIALLFDECVVRVAQPIFLRLLIRSFSDKSVPEWDQYFFAFGVCFTSFLHAVIIHPLAFEILHIGMKCRVSTCSLIYRKILRLSKRAQEETTIGQLVNLLSNDVNRFDMNLLFISYLIIGPIQTVIFVYFLWEELGVSCLAGVGIVFLLMPLQYYIGMLSRFLRFQIAEKSDKRGRIMNEIIVAMRVIKMYAWEKPFSSLVHQVRKEEVDVLRKRAYLRSFYLSLFLSSKKFIPYLTFLVYVLFGHTLTADKVFFAVTIFDIVIANMVSTLPSAAAGVGELTVAIRRIEDFLLMEEKSEELSLTNGINEVKDKAILIEEKNVPSVRMDNVSASWIPGKLQLDGVCVNLSGDKLVMIVGPVGCGKSSFFQLVLKELRPCTGKLSVNGKVTYSVQDPWIFSGTLRQNICFGKEYDEELYDDVVSACALREDFKQFPSGDGTRIGERGITLSGGQKARLNLARALYREGDIYLLDDPLSAVDSRVSRHIFDKCIKQYLSGKLRILITHQLQYLPRADHIIVVNTSGRIIAQGTYDQVHQEGIDFMSLISTEVEPDLYRKASITKLEAFEQTLKKEEETLELHKEAEKMATGSVSIRTYWEYFRAGDRKSFLGMILMFLGFIISQFLYTASDWWLSYWTNMEEAWSLAPKNYTSSPTGGSTSGHSYYWDQYYYIIIYSCLVASIALATNAISTYFFRYCMKISINVHDGMFTSVVRAPMKFFDNNPSGRIMNRFTKDLCSMDESLPSAFFDVITILLIMAGVIVVVIMSNLYVSVPSVFLILALWMIRRFYIQTARAIKRIEAISKSPLFSHLTASVQGLPTIRALHAPSILIKQFDGHQDIHSSAWFLFISSNRWFGIWLEMISVTFLTIVTFSFMIIASSTKSGFVGLAISSVLSITFKFQWGMRQSAEMENLMTSVERCLEYTRLPSEPDLESSPELKPPENWPSEGCIRFQNVCLTYDDRVVLDNLTFEIPSKSNIGIVGRTGAGKSSIISAFFRMAEVQAPSAIYIDGVNILEIGLHDVRRHISIIPQDPILFMGSVRHNIDPFGEFEDKEILQVVEDVGLRGYVTHLDMKVIDGGSNFSLGQRQLVCLARAILRKNKIIVLDEATANVDPRTDIFIQTTIRQKFKDCTIITIAHRLHTVMDCDKILVLDKGKVMEYDRPHILLEDTGGVLYSMAQHTGRSNFAYLKNIAAMHDKTKGKDANK